MSDNKQKYQKLLLDVNKLTITLNQAQAELDRVFIEYVRLQNNGRSASQELQKVRQLMEALHKISIDAVRDSLTTLAKKVDNEINPTDLNVSLDLLDDSAFYNQTKH